MRFWHVDVFAESAFRGNALAVFPDAGGLSTKQMQAIASEMNLSETCFVTAASRDAYSVRIFTPRSELPFAGHPTIGTAWVLRELGELHADEVQQTSPAGATRVTFSEGTVWFERSGRVFEDLRLKTPQINDRLAKALGLTPGDIGLEPRELGRSVDRLQAAPTDIGIKHLMVPVRDLDALGRCRPVPDRLDQLETPGVYCFTAVAAGRLQARGFFPGLGIAEDPATGSAAAGLGVYLADRSVPSMPRSRRVSRWAALRASICGQRATSSGSAGPVNAWPKGNSSRCRSLSLWTGYFPTRRTRPAAICTSRAKTSPRWPTASARRSSSWTARRWRRGRSRTRRRSSRAGFSMRARRSAV